MSAVDILQDFYKIEEDKTQEGRASAPYLKHAKT